MLDGVWKGQATLLTHAVQEIPVSQVIIASGISDQRAEFLALIARDIAEIKRAEESLRTSEQFYRRIVEAASIGIWIIDTEDQTSFVSPKMAKMLD